MSGRAVFAVGRRTLLRAAAFAPAASIAQPFPTPPLPAPPRPLAIDAPVERRLANGLRVVVARRSDVPLVSALVVVRAGAERDPPRLAGLASFTAGLLARGTRTRSAPALVAAAEALGSSLESGAGWRQTLLAMTVVTPLVEPALALLGEALREPAFAGVEIERLRGESIDALRVALASPGRVAALAAAGSALAGTSGAHSAAGTPASLARIARDDVVAAHRDAVRPERTVLILAGDIDAEGAVALAERRFGGWRAAAPATEAASTLAPAPTAHAVPPLTLVDMGESGQAAVALGVALPERSGADRATSAVLNAVLGGGYSARLNQDVRVRRGLSYDASSAIESRGAGALLLAAAQTQNTTAAEVARLLHATLDGLAAETVGDAELAARKAALVGRFGRSIETTAGLADAVRDLVVHDLAVGSLVTRIGELQAVDAARIRRYAELHFARTARTVAIAGEASVFETAARADEPRARRVRVADLDPHVR